MKKTQQKLRCSEKTAESIFTAIGMEWEKFDNRRGGYDYNILQSGAPICALEVTETVNHQKNISNTCSF